MFSFERFSVNEFWTVPLSINYRKCKLLLPKTVGEIWNKFEVDAVNVCDIWYAKILSVLLLEIEKCVNWRWGKQKKILLKLYIEKWNPITLSSYCIGSQNTAKLYMSL